MPYAPAEMGIRAGEDRPYGQGARDLEDERARRQAAQSTGKPQDAPAPAGSPAPTPGSMQSPDAQDRNAAAAPEPDQPSDPPPDWPADVALRQQPTHQYLVSRGQLQRLAADDQSDVYSPAPRVAQQRGIRGEKGMPADLQQGAEFDNFGRLIDPTLDARGRAGAEKFWGDVGNAPVIKQVAAALEASNGIARAGLGFLAAIPPAQRGRYYENIAAKAKELGLPPDDPNVMWQAAQEQWLQEIVPVPVIKGLIEGMVDPSNLFFLGAGEAVGAVRAAGGVREVAGAAGRAAAEAGPKVAGSFAESMGVRVPQRVTAQSLKDSPEVLRLQSIADRLKALPPETLKSLGLEKDVAEINAQLAEVRGQGARPGKINASLVQGMKPNYRIGQGEASEITWAAAEDKAIYTVTNSSGAISKSHGAVMDALRAAGFDDAAIVARGKEIRADLKAQYRQSPGESLYIDSPNQIEGGLNNRIGGPSQGVGGGAGVEQTAAQRAGVKVGSSTDMTPPESSHAGRAAHEARMTQVEREAAIRRGEIEPSEVIPGEPPPQQAGRVRPTQQEFRSKTALRTRASEGKTPFESPANETGGVTRAEMATAPIVYPTEENLGLAKGLMDSLPDDMRAGIIDDARAIYDEIQQARGGVVPLSQVDAESERILIDAGVLAQAGPRSVMNAPGTKAVMRALFRVKEERMAIEAEAHSLASVDGKIDQSRVSDQMRARFAVKMFEENSLIRVMAGARAEWGRVGQQLNSAIRSGDEVRIRNTYNEIIRAVGKDNINKVMDRLQAIRSDPQLLGNPYARKVAEFKFVKALNNATGWQKLDEVFYNAVLSIPHTHMGIILGQLLLTEVEGHIASFGGAAVNAAASAATFGRIPYEQTFTKAIGQAIGTHVGTAQGLRAAKVFLRTGVKRDELAQFVETGRIGRGHALQDITTGSVKRAFTRDAAARQAIKDGRTIVPVAGVGNLPTTLIDSYTVAFHEMGRQQSLWGQAFAKAQQEKVGSVFSKAFRARVTELLDDPAAALDITAARDQGRRVSLRGNPKVLPGLSGWLRAGRDLEIPSSTPLVGKVLGGMAPGRRVVPFINIAFNLASLGVEYSPLGFIRVVNPANALGAGERSVAAARAGMGSLLFKHLWEKAAGGELSGPMPTDPNERALWQRDHKQPYSYKVGNEWIPFDRILGPMATPARWVAGMQAASKDLEGKPLDVALIAATGAKMIWAMGEAFGDTTFMIGPDQIIQAGKAITKGVQGGDANAALGGAANYAGQQAVSQLPFSGFLRSWAQSADPLARHVQGFLAQLEAVLPGLSTNLPPVTDAYGKPVERQAGQQGLSGVFNPIRATTETIDPIDAELGKHTLPALIGTDGQPLPQKQLFASMAAKDIARFKLNADEGAMVQTLAGRATHQALTTLFATAAYQKLDKPAQTKAIQKAITESRHAARGAVADAILQKATTSAEIARGADMRISLLGPRYEKVQFLDGLQKSLQGRFDAAVRKGIDERLNPPGQKATSPTVAEYLKVAPLIRQYLAAPPFDRGNLAVWATLAAARKKHSELATRDRLDGTKNAEAFLKSPEARIIAQYEGEPIGHVRQSIRDRNATLVPYLGGTHYVQVR